MHQTITYRTLTSGEYDKIKMIDRGEIISESYIIKNNSLILVPDHQVVTGFTTDELVAIVQRQHTITENGGIVTGAFNNELLIGVASLEKQKRGSRQDLCKMDILYISTSYRNKGIATRLLTIIKQTALHFGASGLYISATPTRNTVDFYLKHGASLATPPDAALLALEPLDIHLELPVQ